MRRLTFVAQITGLILFPLAAVLADVPATVTIQGRLTDSTGTVVPDGPYLVNFQIYGSPGGSDQLWGSGFQPVQMSAGLFTYDLGTAVALPDSLFTSGSERYLGITVGTDPEMTPRVQLTTGPFAFQAAEADSSDYALAIADNTVTSTKIANGTILLADIAQNGAGAGQIIKWDGIQWVVADDNSGAGGWNWADSSSHGPDSVLYADSALHADTTIHAQQAAFADSTDAITDGAVDFADIGQNGAAKNQVMKWIEGAWVAANDEVGTAGAWSDDGTVVRLSTSTDSVGIGTAVPAARLEVAGDVIIRGKTTIGPGHTNTGTNAIVAGANNNARGNYSVVAGGGGPNAGDSNSALGNYSAIGGGRLNVAGASSSTIGGGDLNSATGDYASIGGGFSNVAYHQSTVAGGMRNEASGFIATVGGGQYNKARGNLSVVAGGGGTTSADSNVAAESHSTVGGGGANIAAAQGATVSGGKSNLADGDYATVGGGLSNLARGAYSTISGGGGPNASDSNSAAGEYATIGGGRKNRADSAGCVVGGGSSNSATGAAATISGGQGHDASGLLTTITGGSGNSATDEYAVVCGGSDNIASGKHSSVIGGHYSQATAFYSLAIGAGTEALHSHSVVIGASDRTSWGKPYTIQTSCSGQMVLYAGEEFYLTRTEGAAAPCGTWFLGTSTGAYLTTGGVWTNASDAHKKENRTPLDRRELLEKLATLPIEQWNYKDEDPSVRHIGPMAQDFHSLFGVGGDSTSISTIDPSGIALAAIQELYKTTRDLEARTKRVDVLEAEVRELRNLLQEIRDGRP